MVDPMFESNVEQREVSLLFADLRDSSQLAATLDSKQAFELFSEVMDCLTAAVMDHQGCVVDYYGDGLTAMWNAPVDEPQHAELACRAALCMLETLPEIESDWQGLSEFKLRLGIGIHSGAAQIGNTGSRRQAKYGPRGPAVNLASRVEAATKVVGVPLLATADVVTQLPTALMTYRVCRAALHGVHNPVDLYGVISRPAEIPVMRAIGIYERALSLFEAAKFDEAAMELARLDVNKDPVPVTFLTEHVERAVGARKQRRVSDRSANSSAGVIALDVK